VWDAVRRVRAKHKPVIASFSDVAASGGYYLAAGADAIVAPPGAYTGSIGVFALRPVVGGLLDKLGIHVESFTRGERADFLLSAQPLSEGARERLRTLVLDTYDLFVRRVAEGRELDAAAVDAVGQGRVWTGEQAVELGLVDELGGLHEAVAAGRRAAGLAEDADVALVLFPRPAPLAAQIAEALELSRARLAAARLPLPAPVSRAARTLESWLADLPPEGPLLLPPLAVEIR
jgi:protease-4